MSLNELSEGDNRRNQPRLQPGNIERNLELLAQVEAVAKDKGITTTQLALAWLMAQGPDIIPIPSSKSRNHLEENVKAVDVKLTDDDLQRLDAILPYGAAAGKPDEGHEAGERVAHFRTLRGMSSKGALSIFFPKLATL